MISTEKKKKHFLDIPKRLLPHLERAHQYPEWTLPEREWPLSHPERELSRP